MEVDESCSYITDVVLKKISWSRVLTLPCWKQSQYNWRQRQWIRNFHVRIVCMRYGNVNQCQHDVNKLTLRHLLFEHLQVMRSPSSRTL